MGYKKAFPQIVTGLYFETVSQRKRNAFEGVYYINQNEGCKKSVDYHIFACQSDRS